MATEQSQTHKLYSCIAKMLYYYRGALNFMYVQVVKLRRKSHSLLDDSCTVFANSAIVVFGTLQANLAHLSQEQLTPMSF